MYRGTVFDTVICYSIYMQQTNETDSEIEMESSVENDTFTEDGIEGTQQHLQTLLS